MDTSPPVFWIQMSYQRSEFFPNVLSEAGCFFGQDFSEGDSSNVLGLGGVKCVGGWERSAPPRASRWGPPDYSESNLKQLFTIPKQVSNNPKQVSNNFLLLPNRFKQLFTTPKQVLNNPKQVLNNFSLPQTSLKQL